MRQRSPEWYAYRRTVITSTDLPVILGLSPYRCEADLADEKLGITVGQESTIRMRIGSALEPMIAEEYERVTGRRVRHFRAMLRHPEVEWAACSPDFGVVGARRLVEAKRTSSRTRFADGLPQDVECQVAWALGVSGYPVADVAVLTDDALTVYEVPASPATFEGLVDIAADFRARLAAGGPFAQSADSLKRKYPADNGMELIADQELEQAATTLLALRASRKATEAQEEALENAIKTRMADASVLVGSTWRATWKRTKDTTTTDWKLVADGLLRKLPETDRQSIVGLHSMVRAGFRPLRIGWTKEEA